MKRFTTACSLTALVATLASAGIAHAQSAPDEPAGAADAVSSDIVVTGFRRSLDNANKIKRDSAIISDTIAAEDIGKYPDNNIAESLQRVTGVQITRFRGEGSAISIRGLSPSFVSTQVNGHQIVSGGGRAFNFLDLSPDFVSAVEVQKSPTAEMEDGGLSGTVNILTPQPLNTGKTTISGRLEGVYNANREKAGPRASVIGTWVNQDRTFGINLGVAYEKRKLLSYDLQSYGAETANESPAATPSGSGKVPPVDYNGDGDYLDTYAFDHAQSYYVRFNDRTRFSLTSAVQWKPSDTVEFFANGLYSYFRDEDDGLDSAIRWTNIAPATPGGPYGIIGSTIDTSFNDVLLGGAEGFVTSMNARGVDFRADAQPVHNTNRVYSGTVGTKLDFGRLNVKLEGDYSLGKSFSSSFYPGVIGRADATITHPNGLGGGPAVTFDNGYDPLDASTFAFNNLNENKSYNRDRMIEAKLDLTYDLGSGFLRSIKAGGLYSDRHFTFRQFTANTTAQDLARLSNGQLVYQPTVEGGSVNAAPILSVASYNTGVPNFLPSFLYFDFNKFFSIIPRSALEQNSPLIEQLASGLDVREKTAAGYAMVTFKAIADRLSGNIGGRFVHTELVSKGYGADLDAIQIAADEVGTIVPASDQLRAESSYDYFLPSLNLRYELTPSLLVRFAAARVLARPEFGQLGVGLTVNANVLSIFSANPYLKPYKANQLDLSFEYYLPQSGLISLAFFYKDVKDFIVNGQTLDTRTATRADGSPVTLTFRRNQPINLEDVKIKGIEFGAQVPFTFLPGVLNGFGVFGNATYIDAPKVPAEQDGLPFPLPGVSKFSYNIGAFFEKWGIGARAYYNWRGKYDTGEGNYFGDREYEKAYGQLDGSISYDITPQVTVSLDFENLTNSIRYHVNNFGLDRQYLKTGRRFAFGVRAKL
jgi:iron complex outermembrane receptor protein